MWYEVKFFAYGYPIFPALFAQEVFLFSIELPWPLYLNTAAAAAKSLQSCPTLRDPMDCSSPGSSTHEI